MIAFEIVLADFSVSRFAPIVLSCVTATATSRALLSGGTELQAVSWTLQHSSEIAVYLLLGVAAGGAGMLYIRAVHAAEEVFSGGVAGRFAAGLSRLRPEWRAAIGGFAVGLFGLLSPRILGTGIETMNAALAGELAFGALALTFAMKLFATAATLGSGSPGGSFFPAVFLGAMFGGAFGRGVHFLLPSFTSAPGSYAAVGMGVLAAEAPGVGARLAAVGRLWIRSRGGQRDSRRIDLHARRASARHLTAHRRAVAEPVGCTGVSGHARRARGLCGRRVERSFGR